MRTVSLALACAIAVFLSPLAVSADLAVKMKNSTDTYKKDKKDGETKVENYSYWFAGDKVRMDGEESSVLLRLDKDTMYLIDNKKKTYNAVQLSAVGVPAGAPGDEQEAAAAAVNAMFGAMFKMEVTVEPTGESKKIGEWNCTKYVQTMKMAGTTTVSDLWATEQLKVDKRLMAKLRASQFMQQAATMKDMIEKIVKESEKINGFVVYTKSSATFGNTRSETVSEVIEAGEGTPPAGAYEVPAKYKFKKIE